MTRGRDTQPDDARVLRERARRLAAPPPREHPRATVDVLEFGLADERYAIEAARIDDVQPLREITPLPCTPGFLRGLVNIRGRLVPVVDLKKFFGLPEQGITDLHRVLLLRTPDIELGLLADTVEGVHPVDIDAIQPSLPTLGGIDARYLRGITADRMVVLDAEAILADPRLIIDEDVPA
jgi:purine-binding chemotaxis protein CheW